MESSSTQVPGDEFGNELMIWYHAQMGPAVAIFAAKKLGTKDDGEDVAQDVAVALYTSRTRFQVPYQTHATKFCWRVAWNKINDIFRHRKVVHGQQRAVESGELSIEPDPSECAERAEESKLIPKVWHIWDETLEELAPLLRDSLLSHQQFSNETQANVAKRHGVSEATVVRRAKEALKAFQAKLTSAGIKTPEEFDI